MIIISSLYFPFSSVPCSVSWWYKFISILVLLIHFLFNVNNEVTKNSEDVFHDFYIHRCVVFHYHDKCILYYSLSSLLTKYCVCSVLTSCGSGRFCLFSFRSVPPWILLNCSSFSRYVDPFSLNTACLFTLHTN